MKNIFKNNQKGFTLVEAMIAVGIFTVVMTIGIGSIISVSSTQRKTQSMRAVTDNLSFLMEEMARSMRLGSYFFCSEDDSPSILELVDAGVEATQNGVDCKSIVFEPFWDFQAGNIDNQVMYSIRDDQDGNGTIFKKDFDNPSFDSSDLLAMTPKELNIDAEKSGFTVIGAGQETFGVPLQPRVTIVLIGTVKIGGVETEFNLQTTVSQRLLEVPPSI